MSEALDRYDRDKSYAWNCEHAPEVVGVDVPSYPGPMGGWRFLGMEVGSPLGIPAGPLLNGKWVLYYASLGWDVLTYKTVRRKERACYGMPNLCPVRCVPLTGGEERLEASEEMKGSWAVSYGMPSAAPEVWRKDVEETKERLGEGKVLSVSVVGTMEDGWGLEELGADYAWCGKMAKESGADCVEANFSCPNVSTCDGQLYEKAEDAGMVAKMIREAIGATPLILKIGHVDEVKEVGRLLDAVGEIVDGLAMTNSVAAMVVDGKGNFYFNGERRGICGAGTREASLRQTRMFAKLIGERGLDVNVIGVGGCETADHVEAYLEAGAESVHMATRAMTHPGAAMEIRREVSKRM